MRKKILTVLLITTLALSLCACGKKEDQNENSSSAADTDEESTDTENTDMEDTDTESTKGLDWPAQYMNPLPEPDSKISYIQRMNVADEIPESDTTTPPTGVNVIMNEMTEKEAEAYYDTLKAAGYSTNTDEVTDEKILLIGALNDGSNNSFVFSYLKEDHYGNVSITYMDAIYSK